MIFSKIAMNGGGGGDAEILARLKDTLHTSPTLPLWKLLKRCRRRAEESRLIAFKCFLVLFMDWDRQ